MHLARHRRETTHGPQQDDGSHRVSPAQQELLIGHRTGGPATVEPVRGRTVLQRVVLPASATADPDVLPLYVETRPDRGMEAPSEEPRRRRPDAQAEDSGTRAAAVGLAQDSVRFGAVPGPAGRGSCVVEAQRRVSFATYFNAFPAAYWRRWTPVRRVSLQLRVEGEGSVLLYRSTASGRSHRVAVHHLRGGVEDVTLAAPLDGFADGGWYWFDVIAGAGPVRLHEAAWTTAVEPQPDARISIGITTYNRPESVTELLAAIGSSPELLAILDAVYLVDQGDRHPDETAAWAVSVAPLGDRLRLVRQANVGGSGGFARAMLEAVEADRSDQLLLLDDDIELEPEGVLRAVAFAGLATDPTIVGGHMFSLHDRSVLHALGESVEPRRFWWGPAPATRPSHDFGRRGLRHTPWLHRRVDVDYTGWWTCLIPVSVLKRIGLSAPMFIKWDDVEFALRARKAGVPTVTLPGVASWHVPWEDKNDELDWQAYFHVRNRLITALLHSPFERGGAVVSEVLQVQLQHLLSMQYSTAALRIRAIEDVLAGPEALHAGLATKRAELRALTEHLPDAGLAPDAAQFPPARQRRPQRSGARAPRNPVDLLVKAALATAHQLVMPVGAASRTSPASEVAYQDAVWWRLTDLDSVLVSAADGTGVAWYRRDPAGFRRQLARSVALHTRLWRRWGRLAAVYRAAMPELTSPERWDETLRSSD